MWQFFFFKKNCVIGLSKCFFYNSTLSEKCWKVKKNFDYLFTYFITLCPHFCKIITSFFLEFNPKRLCFVCILFKSRCKIMPRFVSDFIWHVLYWWKHNLIHSNVRKWSIDENNTIQWNICSLARWIIIKERCYILCSSLGEVSVNIFSSIRTISCTNDATQILSEMSYRLLI